MASEDEDEEQTAGRLLRGELRGEEQAREMPEEFFIGTPQAFENGYEKLYRKKIINGETIFLCNTKSSSGRAEEFALLRRESGVWIAYNSSRTGNALTCRNAIFRCKRDITSDGYHVCEINESATPYQELDHCIWSEGICFLTKLSTMVTNTEVFNEEIQ